LKEEERGGGGGREVGRNFDFKKGNFNSKKIMNV
jgi:hypothetical protein